MSSPVAEPAAAEARRRRVCIVKTGWVSPSETFIRAKARYLPAPSTIVDGLPPRRYQRERSDPIALSPVRHLRDALWRAAHPGGVGRHYQRILEECRADLVMAEYGITAVNVLPACRALDLPLVVHFHGIDAYHRLVLRAYLEGYRRVFRYASAVLTASAAMREHLVRLGADPARTHALPCGVDCSLFSPRPQASRAPVFLAVGRFVAKKAPQRTLEAFARVSRECPDARLRMVGYGPLSGHCRTAVRRLGIQEKVAFPGRREHEAVCEELQGALAFVQHSVVARSGDSEGTPVSILEAASAGLPVVATRHGGIPECVLDGHSGLLVEEGDVEGMAHAMIRLIREPGLAEAMGRRGREHVQTHYSMDEYATRLQSIFMESLGGPAGGQAGRSYSAYAVPSAIARTKPL